MDILTLALISAQEMGRVKILLNDYFIQPSRSLFLVRIGTKLNVLFSLDLIQQLLNGLFTDRMDQVRGDVRQGHQDKGPLSQPGMGDDQLGRRIDDLVAVKQDIDINGTRESMGTLPSLASIPLAMKSRVGAASGWKPE